MSGNRIQRVAELIRDELAGLLGRDVDEARQALVTITEVALSGDMRAARVFVSVFPDSADSEEILKALRRRRGRLKKDLGRALRLRHIPDLDFRLDETARRSERIHQLLEEDGPHPEDEDL
jgi:ribosome-binding factor A